MADKNVLTRKLQAAGPLEEVDVERLGAVISDPYTLGPRQDLITHGDYLHLRDTQDGTWRHRKLNKGAFSILFFSVMAISAIQCGPVARPQVTAPLRGCLWKGGRDAATSRSTVNARA
jgi:hypothetical protein